MKKNNESTSRFVVCINNEAYPTSLELHKIYRVVPDKAAVADGDLRVIELMRAVRIIYILLLILLPLKCLLL